MCVCVCVCVGEQIDCWLIRRKGKTYAHRIAHALSHVSYSTLQQVTALRPAQCESGLWGNGAREKCGLTWGTHACVSQRSPAVEIWHSNFGFYQISIPPILLIWTWHFIRICIILYKQIIHNYFIHTICGAYYYYHHHHHHHRGPLSLVSTIEELLGRKSSGSGVANRDYGVGDPSRWPRGTLYPQKLALTSPTNGGRSVGIVRSRTEATEFSFFSFFVFFF
jgi:hypothetical protein